MIKNLLLLYPARRQRRIEAISRHVAEQCIDEVVAIVADCIQAMGLCEARGYIRARAALAVRRQAQMTLMQIPEADDAWETEIVARAADRLAPLALRRCAAQERKGKALAARRAA